MGYHRIYGDSTNYSTNYSTKHPMYMDLVHWTMIVQRSI